PGGHHRARALVEHARDGGCDAHRPLHRDLAVQLDGLLPVHEHGRVEGPDVREPASRPGDDGEGGQHPLAHVLAVLGGELQLEAGGVEHPRSHAQGVEEAVLRGPRPLHGPRGLAYGVGVDGHALSFRSVAPGGEAQLRMVALGAALATRSGTTALSSPGSQRSPLSTAGPRCQPSATAMVPPETRNTRPVTSPDSGLPSHTTRGETFSGAERSNSPALTPGRPPPRFSVIRVRAPGAMALTVTP